MNMRTRLITQDRVKELLDYDPKTGIFTWKVNDEANNAVKGEVAGYRFLGLRIRVDMEVYSSKHLAWLYTYGYMPLIIAHKNNDRFDVSIDNLEQLNAYEITRKVNFNEFAE